jgi:UMF1 family MFS transporter
MSQPQAPRGALAWAFYDWANSAFATTVVAGFFPVFFKDFWNKGVPDTVSTARLAFSLSAAGILVAILAPILGSLADQGAGRKKMLAIAASVAILATAALPFVPQPAWLAAAALYVVAYVAWLSSCVFYDSLIVVVSTPRTVDRVSGFGFALGYLGGGLLFAFNVAMVQKPELFGLADKGAAVRVSFLTVAVWWALFSLPLLLRVPEPGTGARVPLGVAARRGFEELSATFHKVRRYRNVLAFLVAYWLYIDGVDTVITMAVDYGKSLGFGTGELISSLLLVQFVAFPCAWAFGWMGQRFGTRRLILAGLCVYVVVTILAVNLRTTPWNILGFEVSQFAGLAFLIGTVQGGVQALSRALYSRLIPENAAAEFFGFYNMVGRFAAIIGPVLIGTVGHATGNPRAGIGSIALLLVGGGLLLLRVRDERATA